MKSIELIIAPDGSSRLETQGFVGSECREASRFLEQALGRQSNEQLKLEFHQTTDQKQQLRHQ